MSNFSKLENQAAVVESTLDIATEDIGMTYGVQYDITNIFAWKKKVNQLFQDNKLVNYVKKQCESIYKSKREGNKKQKLSKGVFNRKVVSAIRGEAGIKILSFKNLKMLVTTSDIGDDINIPMDYTVAILLNSQMDDHIEAVFLITEDPKGNITADRLEVPKDKELSKIWYETVYRK